MNIYLTYSINAMTFNILGDVFSHDSVTPDVRHAILPNIYAHLNICIYRYIHSCAFEMKHPSVNQTQDHHLYMNGYDGEKLHDIPSTSDVLYIIIITYLKLGIVNDVNVFRLHANVLTTLHKLATSNFAQSFVISYTRSTYR